MLALGDLNGDGQVNTFDIDLFVDVMGGNLMSARRYQYDEENRLTAVAEIDGNPLLEIEYDALGRRIATIDYEAPGGPQQMRHVYSGLNTVAEYVWSGSQWTLAREVLWGERFPEPLALFDFTAAGDEQAGTEEVLHYVHDALGSVVGLVDAGDPDATPEPVPPKLVERYDYDPYGKTYIESWDASAGGGSGAWVRTTASAYGNPFAWTGQRYDAGVGMYHFPFRSFSPELGRWMQRDPLGYVGGISLYAYAGSMAVSMIDPLGLIGELTIYVKRGSGSSGFGEMGHAFVGITVPGDWPDHTRGRGSGKWPGGAGAGKESILGYAYPVDYADDVNNGAHFDYSASFLVSDLGAAAALAAIAQAEAEKAGWSLRSNCVGHVMAVAEAAKVQVDPSKVRDALGYLTPDGLEGALKAGAVEAGPHAGSKVSPGIAALYTPANYPYLQMLRDAWREALQAYWDWRWWIEVGRWQIVGPPDFGSDSKRERELYWELMRLWDLMRRHLPDVPLDPVPCPHDN